MQCHGGGGGSGGNADLFCNSSEEEEATPKDDAVGAMKELGIERIARREFDVAFKSTFRGAPRVLGQGTYATVFLHRDCRPSAGAGEMVATKVPKLNVGEQSVWQELLYQAVTSQDCQHIVRLRAWIDDGGKGNFDGFGGAIMEYCRDSLTSLTKSYEGLLPVLTQSTALRGTARGLAHMHGFAIAHLDLTPSNILIHWPDDGGLLIAKIADFGCSVRLRELPPSPGAVLVQWPRAMLQNKSYPEYLQCTCQAEMTCTWTYRGPEISLGLPYGFPSDVWSLGVIARELVTGRNLYHHLRGISDTDSLEYASLHCGPITNEVWPDVQNAPYYKPPSAQFKPDDWKLKRLQQVDENSLDFVRRILQADPAKRPTAAHLVASGIWAQPLSEDRLPPSEMGAGMPSKVRRTSEVAARNGAVATPHSAETAANPNLCQCPGAYSRASWGLCKGGRKPGVEKCLCSQPTARSSLYCQHCLCIFCDKIRHKSSACWRHQWLLCKPEYKFVRGFGPSLTHMGPPDLIAFVKHGLKSQILSCPAAAVLAAQMSCPVAIKYFCGGIGCGRQEAKTGQGLMSIFLETVRHAIRVATDEGHRDHKELKEIWRE